MALGRVELHATASGQRVRMMAFLLRPVGRCGGRAEQTGLIEIAPARGKAPTFPRETRRAHV